VKSELKLIFPRIQRLRLKQGWTWERVSQELGVSKVMLHYVKTGKRALSGKVLYRLEEAEIRAGLKQQKKEIDSRDTEREPFYGWMLELRQRWRRHPSDRDEIALAMRVLFPKSANEVLVWLQGQ
jgi:transcriptional regulator with XRE-family HTH domain